MRSPIDRTYAMELMPDEYDEVRDCLVGQPSRLSTSRLAILAISRGRVITNVFFKAMEGAKASGEPGSNALIARESAEMNVRKVVDCIKLLLDAGLQRMIVGNRPVMVSASLP